MRFQGVVILALLFANHLYCQTKLVKGYYIEANIAFNNKINRFPFAYFLWNDSVYVASCYKFYVPNKCDLKKLLSYSKTDSLYRILSAKLPPTYDIIEIDKEMGDFVLYRVCEIEVELQILLCRESSDMLFGCVQENVVCPQNIICVEPTGPNQLMEKIVIECKDRIIKNFNNGIYNRIGIE